MNDTWFTDDESTPADCSACENLSPSQSYVVVAGFTMPETVGRLIAKTTAMITGIALAVSVFSWRLNYLLLYQLITFLQDRCTGKNESKIRYLRAPTAQVRCETQNAVAGYMERGKSLLYLFIMPGVYI